MLLDDVTSFLNKIKESHIKNEASYLDGHTNDLSNLDHFLVEDVEVELSSSVSDV